MGGKYEILYWDWVVGKYVSEGYLWNSGMFCFTPELFVEECMKYSPEVVSAFMEDVDTAYSITPKISIDYGLMEKTNHAAVVPLTSSWSDVGSFDALYAVSDKDENENVVTGEYITPDGERNLIHSDKIVATIGLSDVAVITMGQSPKGDTYNEEGSGAVFYQGRGEFGWRFPTRRLFTTEPKRMATINDVLISVRAPVGDVNVAYEECCIGRGLGAIHSKDNHQSYVLYTVLSLKEKFEVFNGEGTVFGSINRDGLNNMEIVIPPAKVRDSFEELVAPIDKMIKSNYEEIIRLTELRDTLLPKLMSGELDVSDLDI